MASLPEPPPELTNIKVLLKCAQLHEGRDVRYAYYCLLWAFKKGFSNSSKNAKPFLVKLMTKLEEMKEVNKNDEYFKDEKAGLDYVKRYALTLFKKAYKQDMSGDFSRSTVQLFLTAGTLLEVVTSLNENAEEDNSELENARKYAKWKACYITDCQKKGEVPIPGPANAEDIEPIDFSFLDPTPEESGPPAPKPPYASIPGPSTPVPPKPAPASAPVPPVYNDADSNEEEASSHDVDDISEEAHAVVSKCLRYASSALNYNDKKTVLENLYKAIEALS